MTLTIEVPEVKVVSASNAYKSFIAPICPQGANHSTYGCYEIEMPPTNAILKQATCLVEQHKLGHVALTSPPHHGVYIVFSLPADSACSELQAKNMMRAMVENAMWRDCDGIGRQFSRQEADMIAGRTIHLTKHHVQMFGWDKQRSTTAFTERARALVEDRVDASTIKDELPMFRCLPDTVLEQMARGGQLLPCLQGHLTPNGTAQELKDCKHQFDRDDRLDADCGACKKAARFTCSLCEQHHCPKCCAEYKNSATDQENVRNVLHWIGTADNIGALTQSIHEHLAAPLSIKDEQRRDEHMSQGSDGTARDPEPAGYEFLPHLPVGPWSGTPNPDPDSPAAILLAKEIWSEQDAARRGHISTEQDTDESEKHTSTQYLGKSSDFVYGGVEAAEMKNIKKDQKIALLRVRLVERGVTTKQVSDYPSFVQLYKDVFVEGKMTDNNVAATREIFEQLVREHDPTFKLPQKPNLSPEVWERLERIIKENPKITKCRARGCPSDFVSKHGELVCSEKCKKKYKMEQKGMTCHMCSKACKSKEFYCPEVDLYVKIDLLDRSEEELGALLANTPDLAKAVIATKRNQDPIIFCSDKCNQKYSSQVVCVSCGSDEATIQPFPNIDTVLQLGRCVERGDFKTRDELLNRCTDHWEMRKGCCSSCGNAMMPRKFDLAPSRTSSLRAT